MIRSPSLSLQSRHVHRQTQPAIQNVQLPARRYPKIHNPHSSISLSNHVARHIAPLPSPFLPAHLPIMHPPVDTDVSVNKPPGNTPPFVSPSTAAALHLASHRRSLPKPFARKPRRLSKPFTTASNEKPDAVSPDCTPATGDSDVRYDAPYTDKHTKLPSAPGDHEVPVCTDPLSDSLQPAEKPSVDSAPIQPSSTPSVDANDPCKHANAADKPSVPSEPSMSQRPGQSKDARSKKPSSTSTAEPENNSPVVEQSYEVIEPWSSDEDNALMEITSRWTSIRWLSVGQLMLQRGYDRSVLEMKRRRTHLLGPITNVEQPRVTASWSAAEDEALLAATRRWVYRVRWRQVALYLEERGFSRSVEEMRRRLDYLRDPQERAKETRKKPEKYQTDDGKRTGNATEGLQVKSTLSTSDQARRARVDALVRSVSNKIKKSDGRNSRLTSVKEMLARQRNEKGTTAKGEPLLDKSPSNAGEAEDDSFDSLPTLMGKRIGPHDSTANGEGRDAAAKPSTGEGRQMDDMSCDSGSDVAVGSEHVEVNQLAYIPNHRRTGTSGSENLNEPRGSWSEKEDELLLQCLRRRKRKEAHWDNVALYLLEHGFKRSQEACQERAEELYRKAEEQRQKALEDGTPVPASFELPSGPPRKRPRPPPKSSVRRWNDTEDSLYIQCIARYASGSATWASVADWMREAGFPRTISACRQRLKRVKELADENGMGLEEYIAEFAMRSTSPGNPPVDNNGSQTQGEQQEEQDCDSVTQLRRDAKEHRFVSGNLMDATCQAAGELWDRENLLCNESRTHNRPEDSDEDFDERQPIMTLLSAIEQKSGTAVAQRDEKDAVVPAEDEDTQMRLSRNKSDAKLKVQGLHSSKMDRRQSGDLSEAGTVASGDAGEKAGSDDREKEWRVPMRKRCVDGMPARRVAVTGCQQQVSESGNPSEDNTSKGSGLLDTDGDISTLSSPKSLRAGARQSEKLIALDNPHPGVMDKKADEQNQSEEHEKAGQNASRPRGRPRGRPKGRTKRNIDCVTEDQESDGRSGDNVNIQDEKAAEGGVVKKNPFVRVTRSKTASAGRPGSAGRERGGMQTRRRVAQAKGIEQPVNYVDEQVEDIRRGRTAATSGIPRRTGNISAQPSSQQTKDEESESTLRRRLDPFYDSLSESDGESSLGDEPIRGDLGEMPCWGDG